MLKEKIHIENCPTCNTQCSITWSGLDLVANTGDETLASKSYTPTIDPKELIEALIQIRSVADNNILHHKDFVKVSSVADNIIKKFSN